jgi:hypothetical protein
LPCSCSSAGTEPGGSLLDCIRPTGATSIGDAARATRQGGVASRDATPCSRR